MSDIFSRLEKLSARLNASSDAINETIKDVEAQLASLRLGVEVWLQKPLETYPLRDDYHNDVGESIDHFGYAKVDGTWRLAFYNVWNDDYESVKTIPLSQTPRETRIKALKRLPELYEALEKEAEAALKEIEEARNAIVKMKASS